MTDTANCLTPEAQDLLMRAIIRSGTTWAINVAMDELDPGGAIRVRAGLRPPADVSYADRADGATTFDPELQLDRDIDGTWTMETPLHG